MSVEAHQHCIEVARGLSPRLVEAIERGGPIVLAADDSRPLAERLCRSVAGQQLSVKAARSIWSRVAAAAGDVPLVDFFIEPNQAVLRSCGLSGAKARSLCQIAEEARAGRLEAEELRGLDPAERTRRLTTLWGVGQWTADMVSIFYFGEPDVWPEGDIAARKTLERLTSLRRKTLRTAARFAPYRSHLALYMWRHVDTPPV